MSIKIEWLLPTYDDEELNEMSNQEIADQLRRIKRGWMPQDYLRKDGTEDDFNKTRMHIAMSLAIEKLEAMKEKE